MDQEVLNGLVKQIYQQVYVLELSRSHVKVLVSPATKFSEGD